MQTMEEYDEIIKLLKDDDGTCFEKVYRHYFAPLYSFATQYLDGEEAEDVVQETMMWLWEHRQTLIPEMSLKSLLFTIVKNRCINSVNHSQLVNRIHDLLGEKIRREFEDPDFYLESELFNLFRETLNTLPGNIRTVYEMSRTGGMTHKEIADKLDVSPQTVNYRLCKALEILRKGLRDFLPDNGRP